MKSECSSTHAQGISSCRLGNSLLHFIIQIGYLKCIYFHCKLKVDIILKKKRKPDFNACIIHVRREHQNYDVI